MENTIMGLGLCRAPLASSMAMCTGCPVCPLPSGELSLSCSGESKDFGAWQPSWCPKHHHVVGKHGFLPPQAWAGGESMQASRSGGSWTRLSRPLILFSFKISISDIFPGDIYGSFRVAFHVPLNIACAIVPQGPIV